MDTKGTEEESEDLMESSLGMEVDGGGCIGRGIGRGWGGSKGPGIHRVADSGCRSEQDNAG